MSGSAVAEQPYVKWLPTPDAALNEQGDSAVAETPRMICLAGVLCPPVGECSWRWRFADCPINTRRSFVEVGIVLEGGDISDNSIGLKLAPVGSSIQTACGTLLDGELSAALDMESGTFEVKGCTEGGPTCDMTVVETDQKSLHSGVGAVRGHLWRPYVRCNYAEGMSVELKDFLVAGRAEPLLVPAIEAGCGGAEAQNELKQMLPGSGGQPGPGIGDIQCLLTADGHRARGALYVSGGFAANERNLALIGATAMLRLGKSYLQQPLPDGITAKVVPINDDRDADFGAYIDESNEFIEDHLMAGRSVLVHCGAGVSRSGSAVVAYLMWRKHLRYKEALETAKRAREWINPNPSFQRQLKSFEERLADTGHYHD